ncbi:MAG: hypothetical protein D6730_22030, partial [Bacteroidetes bacterium]
MRKIVPAGLLGALLLAGGSFFFYQQVDSLQQQTPNPDYEMTSSANPASIAMEQGHLLRAIEAINGRTASQGLAQDIAWQEKGPVNIAGRTRVVLIDAGDTTENTVFAAGVSGGLWKTVNFLAGQQAVWEPVAFDFPNLGICALVQDPAQPAVLYAGTGEFWVGSGVKGAGIWKSADGGLSWTHLPATANSQFEFVNRLLFDQNGHLYAATGTAGLLKSTDGGASWTPVLDSSSGTLSNIAADVELAANGDLYASFGGWTEYDHLYKSPAGPTAGQPGSWSRLVLPDTFQRKEIACAPSQAGRLYVLASENSEMKRLLVSDDGGNSWVGKDPFSDPNSQANYDIMLEVAPDDPDYLLSGGVLTYKSRNAGDEWVRISSVHADVHFAAFFRPDPAFDKAAIVATDGGMWYMWERPGNFQVHNSRARNRFYKTTQFYGLALHPDIGNSEMIGGTQDNGVLFFDEPGQEMVPISNGDGGFPYIDQNEPHLRITNHKQNVYQVSTNGGLSIPDYRTILLDGQAAFINASDYDDIDNILYAATFRPQSYLRIKAVFEENPLIEYIDLSGVLGISATSVDVSPNDNKILYLGTGGRLYRVNDAQQGSSVNADLIMDLPVSGLRNVVVEKGNEAHLLASLLSVNESQDYVWECKNATSAAPTWTSFQGDLPKMPVFWIIFMPGNNDQAMVGTEFGIWITEDIDGANTHWEQARNGLPNVRITQLIHRESDDRIAASSYGRGIFYTQHFEQTYAFFGQAQLQLTESGLQNAPDCRGSKVFDLPVEISKLPAENVSLTVAINAGETSMTEGQDYEILSNTTFTFGPASPLRQFLSIRFFDDAVVENTERMKLQISSSNPGLNISQPVLVVELADDEQALILADETQAVWSESWNERFFFTNASSPWRHDPAVRDLLDSQTSHNLWRVTELCNPLSLFTAAIWYYNAPTFVSSCGYNSELAATSVMYREVDARGVKNLQLAFDWMAGGIPGQDYGSVVYAFSSDSLNWQQLPGEYVAQASPLRANLSLPQELDGKQFLLGWQWQNDALGSGQQGLAISVDNIELNATLPPTTAETEQASQSLFVGSQDEVLFFSENKKIMARLNGNGTQPGCTQLDLHAQTGIALPLDTLTYTGWYLPYRFEFGFEQASPQPLGISLFFRPDDMQAFLTQLGISQDSLAIYFWKESELIPIAGLEYGSIAAATEVSFQSTAQAGSYVLGWLQKSCRNVNTVVNQTICQGESFEGYSQTGTYEDTFTAANGCDSVRSLQLTVLPPVSSSLSASICQGESFEGYSQTGTYEDTFTAANGCD